MINLMLNGALGATAGCATGILASVNSKDTGAVTCMLTTMGLVASVALTLFTTLPVTPILTVITFSAVCALTTAANSSTIHEGEAACFGALFGAAMGAATVALMYVLPVPTGVVFINGYVLPVWPI